MKGWKVKEKGWNSRDGRWKRRRFDKLKRKEKIDASRWGMGESTPVRPSILALQFCNIGRIFKNVPINNVTTHLTKIYHSFLYKSFAYVTDFQCSIPTHIYGTWDIEGLKNSRIKIHPKRIITKSGRIRRQMECIQNDFGLMLLREKT